MGKKGPTEVSTWHRKSKAKQNEEGVSGGRVAWDGELEPELGEEEVWVWG